MSMAKCQDRWHRGSKADGQRRRPQAIGISRGTPAAGVGTHRYHVELEAPTNVRLMVLFLLLLSIHNKCRWFNLNSKN
jgi:hypothetical protein